MNAVALTAAAAEPTDTIDNTVAQFFRPYRHELAAMSPDGRHLAITDDSAKGEESIVIINLDDVSNRAYYIGARADHAVQEMQWASTSRLVFTTASRAVGLLDLNEAKIKVLLLSSDLDAYAPKPILGPRTFNAMVTPDMPAEANAGHPGFASDFRKVSLSDAIEQATDAGDLFGGESKRGLGQLLLPFLLGSASDLANKLLVEIRTDADIFTYNRAQTKQITVPGNVFVSDGPPYPVSLNDLRGNAGNFAEYASYEIETPSPPLVVLELDLATGRRREVTLDQEWRRTWVDRQGRLRLVLEQHDRQFRYLYRGVEGKKWVPLDRVTKGASLGFEVSAQNLLGARSVPLGFDAEARLLFIASNVGRDTFTLRALDVVTGQLEESEIGHQYFDLVEPTALVAPGLLRFDPRTHALAGVTFAAARRQTHWLDPMLARLQTALDEKLAPQHADIREWDAARTRFLVDTAGPGDPGGFAVFDAAKGRLIDCGQRAPWLTPERRNPTQEFKFVGRDGRRFSGYLTLPRQPRLNPSPVLVYFHDGPWYSDPPLFNRGAQALAALGFAVLQLNHRGSSGLGRRHLGAIDAGLDQAVLEDVTTVLAKLGETAPINTRMVAALGHGVGGYLAVRMPQLAPQTFRCAVAINAPGDLDAWRTPALKRPTLMTDLRRYYFTGEKDRLRAQSAIGAGPATKAPVLVVHATEDAYVPVAMGRALYRALRQGSEETRFLELRGEGHGGWSDETTARLFAELGRFFNATIYNYKVEMGPTKAMQ